MLKVLVVEIKVKKEKLVTLVLLVRKDKREKLVLQDQMVVQVQKVKREK